jgi:hypothetical protein
MRVRVMQRALPGTLTINQAAAVKASKAGRKAILFITEEPNKGLAGSRP